MAPPRQNVALLGDAVALRAAYDSAGSIAVLSARLEVSASTVRRALIRHGIDRLPRNRNRRPARARVLDDPVWLLEQYRTRTAVSIAFELGASPRTVYAAMDRHGIERRAEPSTLALTQPRLADGEWLADAVDRASSRTIASELGVSAGTVRNACRQAGIDPGQSSRHYARGRRRTRPTSTELLAAWESEGTFRGVARWFDTAHTTASVWLAEIGVFADDPPKLSRAALLRAIDQHSSLSDIAGEHGVAVTTVRIELHRHGLFEMHRLRHRYPDLL